MTGRQTDYNKVALDCGNGAGAILAPQLLDALGCETVLINAVPDGSFAHQSEPLPENIRGLCRAVVRTKADIGFVQDADADRLAIVNDKGKPLGEEMTLALAALYVLSKKRGSVVCNLSTTQAIDDIAAAGHSNATFAQAITGLRTGISHGTHLFNAMSGLFHRDPGLAGALLLDDGVSIELIADGIHLHPAILSLVMKIKPLEKIILVTDATRRTGLSRTPLRTPDGRLYGSAITLDVALKNAVRWTGRPLAEILPMLTLNPARLLGVTGRKGRLAKGADADIVILDKKLGVAHVFCRGKKVL